MVVITGTTPVIRGIPVPLTHGETRAETVMAHVLMLTVFLGAPLAFGAVQLWAWAGIAVVAVGLLFCWAVGCARQREIRIQWSPFYIPVGLFFLLSVVQFLSGSTADSVATREALIKLATNIILFFVVGHLFERVSLRVWPKVGIIVLLYALALSLFAILQLFSRPESIYWSVKPSEGGYVFGPYVNHNHYAGLMEMRLPISMAFLLSRIKFWRQEPWLWLGGFAIAVSLASVILSGSRGGLVSLIAEGMLIAAILSWRWIKAEEKMSAAVVVLVVLSTLVLFFWAAPRDLFTRFEPRAQSTEVSMNDRIQISLDSLHIVQAHPWFGAGLGSFETVYPRYQSLATDFVIDYAHNDFVQALAETGVIGGLLILVSIGLFLKSVFPLVHARVQNTTSWIRLGAGIGCCGVLVHSLVDFNLHIPANAAWMAFCAGLAILDPTTRRFSKQRATDHAENFAKPSEAQTLVSHAHSIS